MAIEKIDVDPETLLMEVGALSAVELDELPFGAIQLDPDGVVTAYNAAEAQFAGRRADEVVGKNFFRDIAPCTRVRQFQGSFETGVRRRSLNEVFDFTFHFPSGSRQVRIRMIYGERPRPSVWIFVTPINS
jgi:photoactive yellow protein